MKLKCRKININKICIAERAAAGKMYKAGTCYIKLSAVDEFVGQIESIGEIESRYAALEPREGINADYLYIAISRAFPEFLRRYKTTINLQFDTLRYFELDWHDDEKQQQYVVKQIARIDREIEILEQKIDNEKELKKWYLSKMMV